MECALAFEGEVDCAMLQNIYAGEQDGRYGPAECIGTKNQTLCVTPAMEAGISDSVWSIEELVGLLENQHV